MVIDFPFQGSEELELFDAPTDGSWAGESKDDAGTLGGPRASIHGASGRASAVSKEANPSLEHSPDLPKLPSITTPTLREHLPEHPGTP